ncbi:uncharacterized protein LOC101861014 [Aplysia californica]|uniref:Uncharacterized protein LOC101861014 n=1 Tax=Aplysia californica TaxID=6500 RepID=A0ABM0JCL1_APLCA|nr:uncharacterized protein LOC101861014 [Aplysia californica]XP_005090600.1 uncharacterized protein LOC101861014 [Aplysia californica]
MSALDKVFTELNRKELKEKGYTVVRGVFPREVCDEYQGAYRDWLNGFPEGTWPQTKHSLIQKYSVGHMSTSWDIRLKCYPVFSQLWKTEKLLSSIDAIAVGRPPEENEEIFWAPGQSWLHVDQPAYRLGLHAYQGAVYLEDCEEEDWTFEVVEGSHKHFDDLHNRIGQKRCTKLTPEDLEWLTEKGCRLTRVPCPKGGMVLWDSRLLHANARPIEGRRNPGRWRWVVFVCMTPAVWAKKLDLKLKKQAYENLQLTCHWPSRGVFIFSSKLEEGMTEDPNPLNTLPEIATRDTAKRLMGLLPYEGDNNKSVHTLEFDAEKFKDQMTDNDRKLLEENDEDCELPPPYEPFSHLVIPTSRA